VSVLILNQSFNIESVNLEQVYYRYIMIQVDMQDYQLTRDCVPADQRLCTSWPETMYQLNKYRPSLLLVLTIC